MSEEHRPGDIESLIQPQCDHIIKQFEDRHVGDLLQVLVVATLAASIPEALGNIKDVPRSAQVFIDSALTIALEARGFVVIKRRADA